MHYTNVFVNQGRILQDSRGFRKIYRPPLNLKNHYASWSPVLHYLMSPLWPMSFLQKFHFFKSKIGNLSVVHKIRIEYIKPKLGISFGNSTANNKLSWDIFYIDTKNIEHQSWTRNIKNKVTIMYHHNHLYNIHVKNKIIINVTKAMPTKDLHQYPGVEMIQQRLLKKKRRQRHRNHNIWCL